MGMKTCGVIFIPLGVPKAHGELLRKCRAIWQIARTIYQIVLQIFIHLGVPKAHGELLQNRTIMSELGVVIVILHENKVLLTQREDFEMWCLPGGAVDFE
ncbi:MAG: hypothetical protein V9G20_20920 [Candidatus Promineifilaceae bacterium]